MRNGGVDGFEGHFLNSDCGIGMWNAEYGRQNHNPTRQRGTRCNSLTRRVVQKIDAAYAGIVALEI